MMEPLALKKTNNPPLTVRSHSIDAAITAPAYMTPDFFRSFELKKRDNKMLETAWTNVGNQPLFYLALIGGLGRTNTLRMFDYAIKLS